MGSPRSQESADHLMWEVLDTQPSCLPKRLRHSGEHERFYPEGVGNLTLAKGAVGLGVISLQKGESKGSWTLPANLWG